MAQHTAKLEKERYEQCKRTAEEILAPLEVQLQAGAWSALVGVASQLLAIERAKETLDHAAARESFQNASWEVERLRELNLKQEQHIANLEQTIYGMNDQLRDKDNQLIAARKALDESLPAFETARQALDLRFLDVQCLAGRLELALHKPTFQAVYTAVRDELLLLLKTSSLSSPGQPLYPHQQSPLPPEGPPRAPNVVNRELRTKEKIFDLCLANLEKAAKDQHATTPNASTSKAPPGFTGLPRPRDRVRLPTGPPAEWDTFRPSCREDLGLELRRQRNAVKRARDEVARTTPAPGSAASDGSRALAEAATVHASVPQPGLRPWTPTEVIEIASSPPQEETPLPPPVAISAPPHAPGGSLVDAAATEPSLVNCTASPSKWMQTVLWPSPILTLADQRVYTRQEQVSSDAEAPTATRAEGHYRRNDEMPDKQMEDGDCRRVDKLNSSDEAMVEDELEEDEIKD